MNIRDLKYLIAVAETNHFGKAAERCYVSQPTLSGQIKKLEEELGVTLFERTKRSVSITPVGEEIVALSKKLMEQADAIVQLAKAHNNPLAGALRIGVIHTISPYLMPLVLMPLKLAHPELRPVLTEEVTANLMTMLHQHQLDAAIIATDEEGDEYETIRLFEEPFWLAHPS
ncbi:MAG: LysR family transcriptional regulator, partial [Chromatiales bacterium]